MANDNGRIIDLTEGPRTKGGHNPPNHSSERPPAPCGSCGEEGVAGSPGAPFMVLAIGSTVEFGPKADPIEGTILQVGIKATGVIYEVSWWNCKEHKSEWLQACEVRHTDGTRWQPIGFGRRP